jgi:hypothetical protein
MALSRQGLPARGSLCRRVLRPHPAAGLSDGCPGRRQCTLGRCTRRWRTLRWRGKSLRAAGLSGAGRTCPTRRHSGAQPRKADRPGMPPAQSLRSADVVGGALEACCAGVGADAPANLALGDAGGARADEAPAVEIRSAAGRRQRAGGALGEPRRTDVAAAREARRTLIRFGARAALRHERSAQESGRAVETARAVAARAARLARRVAGRAGIAARCIVRVGSPRLAERLARATRAARGPESCVRAAGEGAGARATAVAIHAIARPDAGGSRRALLLAGAGRTVPAAARNEAAVLTERLGNQVSAGRRRPTPTARNAGRIALSPEPCASTEHPQSLSGGPLSELPSALSGPTSVADSAAFESSEVASFAGRALSATWPIDIANR